MGQPDASGPSLVTEQHPWYGLLTLAYLAAVYSLSSVPDFAMSRNDPVFQAALNLFHIPLFAGLAFCVARAISAGEGRHEPSWRHSGVTFLGVGTYAALDEWHQSFVPGRHASLSDFFLDLAGVLAVVLVLHLRALRRAGS